MTDNLFDVQQTNDDTSARDEITAKWKDKPQDELLKAKIESDLYIKTLERQKDELRSDYLKQRDELLAKAKFEDLLTRFESSKDLQVAPPTANEVESQKYDPAEIETLVQKKINESKVFDKESENFQKVQTKLKERFGDNYLSVLQEQKNTDGLSDADVNALAKKSPEAFFRWMGLNDLRAGDVFHTPPRSSQRADQFSPRTVKRDWNYYQELKKGDPRVYLDPKIAVQMHNDAIELGDAFGMPKN